MFIYCKHVAYFLCSNGDPLSHHINIATPSTWHCSACSGICMNVWTHFSWAHKFMCVFFYSFSCNSYQNIAINSVFMSKDKIDLSHLLTVWGEWIFYLFIYFPNPISSGKSIHTNKYSGGFFLLNNHKQMDVKLFVLSYRLKMSSNDQKIPFFSWVPLKSVYSTMRLNNKSHIQVNVSLSCCWSTVNRSTVRLVSISVLARGSSVCRLNLFSPQ